MEVLREARKDQLRKAAWPSNHDHAFPQLTNTNPGKALRSTRSFVTALLLPTISVMAPSATQIEARGNNRTKAGRDYNNAYCNVLRLEGGKLKEWTEYSDTQLIADALGDPTVWRAAAVPAR